MTTSTTINMGELLAEQEERMATAIRNLARLGWPGVIELMEPQLRRAHRPKPADGA